MENLSVRFSVFLDASVVISGCHSDTGGSALILKLAAFNKLKVIVSSLILLESNGNLIKKFPEGDLLRFYQWLGKTRIKVSDTPRTSEIGKYIKLCGLKDAPVLATAIFSKAQFLITLDRKHFLNRRIKKAKLPIVICTPADFLQKYFLPQTN